MKNTPEKDQATKETNDKPISEFEIAHNFAKRFLEKQKQYIKLNNDAVDVKKIIAVQTSYLFYQQLINDTFKIVDSAEECKKNFNELQVIKLKLSKSQDQVKAKKVLEKFKAYEIAINTYIIMFNKLAAYNYSNIIGGLKKFSEKTETFLKVHYYSEQAVKWSKDHEHNLEQRFIDQAKELAAKFAIKDKVLNAYSYTSSLISDTNNPQIITIFNKSESYYKNVSYPNVITNYEILLSMEAVKSDKELNFCLYIDIVYVIYLELYHTNSLADTEKKALLEKGMRHAKTVTEELKTLDSNLLNDKSVITKLNFVITSLEHMFNEYFLPNLNKVDEVLYPNEKLKLIITAGECSAFISYIAEKLSNFETCNKYKQQSTNLMKSAEDIESKQKEKKEKSETQDAFTKEAEKKHEQIWQKFCEECDKEQQEKEKKAPKILRKDFIRPIKEYKPKTKAEQTDQDDQPTTALVEIPVIELTETEQATHQLYVALKYGYSDSKCLELAQNAQKICSEKMDYYQLALTSLYIVQFYRIKGQSALRDTQNLIYAGWHFKQSQSANYAALGAIGELTLKLFNKELNCEPKKLNKVSEAIKLESQNLIDLIELADYKLMKRQEFLKFTKKIAKENYEKKYGKGKWENPPGMEEYEAENGKGSWLRDKVSPQTYERRAIKKAIKEIPKLKDKSSSLVQANQIMNDQTYYFEQQGVIKKEKIDTLLQNYKKEALGAVIALGLREVDEAKGVAIPKVD